MDEITIEDFAKLEIKVGKVIKAHEVTGSDKLIRCVVDFGEFGQRIIFSGIRQWYLPEKLVGLLLPCLVNLKPKKMMGEESQGMFLAVAEDDCVLLVPDKEVVPGSKVC